MAKQDADLHACALAALILHDANVPITGDKMKTLLEASNNHNVQLVYCNIVAKSLSDKDIPALLTQMASAGGSGQNQTSKQDAEWDMLSDASKDDMNIDCGNREDFESDDGGFMDLFS